MTRKYRKRLRLSGFDYSSNRFYFVTTCVNDKVPYFGQTDGGAMCLNQFGEIAHNQWLWLENQFPYVKVHSFVVMPNHVHSIIQINSTKASEKYDNQPFVVKIKPLSELIGAYKTTSSKQIHRVGGIDFQWQRSFHDHIIRNKASFYRISKYIQDNPKHWQSDPYHPDNVLLAFSPEG